MESNNDMDLGDFGDLIDTLVKVPPVDSRLVENDPDPGDLVTPTTS